MRYHTFTHAVQGSYRVALLSKTTAFNKGELDRNYVQVLTQQGIPVDNVIAYTLSYDDNGKAPVKHIKAYLLESLLPALTSLSTEYLYVTDSAYFKILAGVPQAEPHQGYVLPCKLPGYTHFKVVLGLNYQQLVYNPELKAKLTTSLACLAQAIHGTYQSPGTGIIHKAIYPRTHQDIAETLEALLAYPELTCDIEAFSLRFNEAGIGTISFAIDEHNGVAFPVDYAENVTPPNVVEQRQEYGRYVLNPAVHALLKSFFERYQGKLTFHNADYDVKVMIYVLWMQSLLDTKGLLTGLEILTRSIDDTKIIAYLATNTTAGNVLGLKPLAQEFAGNWAKDDIKDIRLIPLQDLLQYNLVDSLSTWYVKKKYYPIMVQDQQEDIYLNLLLPSQQVILQTGLTGMPMNKAKILRLERKLKVIAGRHAAKVWDNPMVRLYEKDRTQAEWVKDYETRKTKAKNPDKILWKDRVTFPQWQFNPGSGPQLQGLLFEQMGLPVLDLTETKQPATGEDTLKKLLNHVTTPKDKELIESLIAISQVSTILSTFVPAFKKAIDKDASGVVWLHGDFIIGGTVSGRLSSARPNLQNIPAKSIFAKLVKECFMGPKGWLFCGADFNSLEDMISALTTKDPNKIRVYTDGYDGHCLRAYYYFKDRMPDIEEAPENACCYKAKVGSTDVYFHAEEQVEYMGVLYKGKDLYEVLTSSGV